MRSGLSKYLVAALSSSRRLNDAGQPLITWFGVLALVGYLHVGGPRRRRLAGIALGVALLILGQGFRTNRRPI